MENTPEPVTPGQVFAARVKEARLRLGWSQTRLVTRLGELGLPMDRTTLAKLEKGERASTAPLDKVFALAAALNVYPVHLFAPLEDETAIRVTPTTVIPAAHARAWIRGRALLPLGDHVNWSEIPDGELRELFKQGLSKGMTPVIAALMGPEIGDRASRMVAEIRTPSTGKEEEHDA